MIALGCGKPLQRQYLYLSCPILQHQLRPRKRVKTSAAPKGEIFGSQRTDTNRAASAKAGHSSKRPLAIRHAAVALFRIDLTAFDRNQNCSCQKIERLCRVLACQGRDLHEMHVWACDLAWKASILGATCRSLSPNEMPRDSLLPDCLRHRACYPLVLSPDLERQASGHPLSMLVEIRKTGALQLYVRKRAG